jgi:hypothetical protein
MSARQFTYKATLTVWAESLSEADELAAEVCTDVDGAEIGTYAAPSLDLTGEPPEDDHDQGEDVATLALTVPMGEHVQSPAEVAGVVAHFVDDCRPSLEAGGFVSGPIHNEDGDRVGQYRIAFPIS